MAHDTTNAPQGTFRRGGAGAACPEILGAAPRQGAPPRVGNCVRQSQHPSGRCGTVRDCERFTEEKSALERDGGASLLRVRSLAG